MLPTKIVRFLGAAIVVIIVLVAFVLDKEGIIPIMESIANVAFLIIGALLTIAFELILFPQKFISKPEKSETVEKEVPRLIDPRFVHLTIHYSQRADTPDTIYPARPRLVVYYEKKKSYWVPTWLEPYIKQHKLNWHTHDGEKALTTWLKKEKIELHETDPSPEDLDLENLLETDHLSVKPKESVEKLPKSTTDISIVKTPSLSNHDKLMEAYSPIHAMIDKINKKIPRESAPQGLVGAWVDASWMDFGIISAVFTQHNDKFRNKDLEMWQEIENELNERKEKRGTSIGFFLDKRRREWFDELEAEYNRLKSSREDSASGNV